MPECQNCEAHVSEAYARVFSYPGETSPRVCLHCEGRTAPSTFAESGEALQPGETT